MIGVKQMMDCMKPVTEHSDIGKKSTGGSADGDRWAECTESVGSDSQDSNDKHADRSNRTTSGRHSAFTGQL